VIAQIEVVGKGLLDREQELLERCVANAHSQGVVALRADDPPTCSTRRTDLLVAGDVGRPGGAGRSGVDHQNGSKLALPGVMSRKKQVAAKLLSVL